MKLNELTDDTALAECRRLLNVIQADRAVQNSWLGAPQEQLPFDENSAFVRGMTAMFRYARGEAVPPVLVKDFIDTFLTMMFCAHASNSLALPPFRRMQDKPWAAAWRLAELRLAFETDDPVEPQQLAHLLGIQTADLCAQIGAHCSEVPRNFIQKLYETIKAELTDRHDDSHKHALDLKET